jgi:hypothetical protein
MLDTALYFAKEQIGILVANLLTDWTLAQAFALHAETGGALLAPSHSRYSTLDKPGPLTHKTKEYLLEGRSTKQGLRLIPCTIEYFRAASRNVPTNKVHDTSSTTSSQRKLA